MAKNFDDKKYFNSLLEKACRGTSITPKELLRELVTSGYKDIYSSDLRIEDLKMIIADLVDSKEISDMYRQKSGKKMATAEIEEVEIEDEDEDEDD